MSYSIQKLVSDGTLSTIVLGVQYLQRNDIYLRIGGVETPQSGAPSGYTWSFLDNNTIRVLPVVPAGVEVVVYRRTDLDTMYNIYSQNAQFDESTIDENNQQLLYIAQEYFEQGIPGASIEALEYVRATDNGYSYRFKLTDGSYTPEFLVPISPNTKLANRAMWTRFAAESGWVLAAGDFETGGVLLNSTQVLLDESTQGIYSWSGVYPEGGKVVAAGTDPTLPGSGYVPRTDVVLRGELADVGALRLLVGNSGDKIYLASYNSGWAAVASPPVGGGKFRWVADNALLDDGVFVFKPTGASGAWVRQDQKKVTPYLAGAKGDNVDDTAAMLRCFNVATAKRLNVHIDKGQYKYTQTPTVGPECNVTGEFSVAELLPVGCDGFKFTSSDAVGGRKFGGFVLLGTGANDAGYTAIVCDPGLNVSKRTTGVSFEDIQIFNFKTAGNFKNLWHSTFRSVNATNVCNGFVFKGRCISNEVGSGTKIIRGSGALVSGECIGVQFIASSDYSPAVEARPEGCSITSSVLVFGFDVAVDVDSMLAGGIFGADLDYCRSFGVRYKNWDGRPTIAPNWIAGDAGYSAQPFVGVYSVPKPTQSTSGPDIKQITMTTFNGHAGDAGVKLGSLNGRATVSNCLISNSSGIGIYDNAGRFNAFKDNQISSPTPIFMFETGGNEITGNNISGGVIADINPTSSHLWGRNSGEYFTDGVIDVPIAAGALSGSINLASLGYVRGVPNSGSRTAMCYYTGGANPGNTWAEISGDGLTVTAYKTVAFGSASELYVRVGLA